MQDLAVYLHNTHYARQYMSNGMIHVQWSFREMCVMNKFWLVDFWIQGPAADILQGGMIFDQSDARRHPVSWILIG